jgi:hypothetical protein
VNYENHWDHERRAKKNSTKQKLHREKGRKKEVGFGVWWRGGVRLSLEP